MGSSVGAIFLGVICLIIGIFNFKGDISTIHSYHRKRVSDGDRVPFGKKMGLSMLIIGTSLIFFGGLTVLSEKLGNDIFTIIGSVILITGLAIGLGIGIYAMIKYNKGIF